jgi:tRNA nucleotidyltransferase (CCA-adding enzyme)
VPVVDAEGRTVGVVTRTDLIKHLGHATLPANRRAEISAELARALPPLLMALTQEAGRHAQELHLNLYVVGGVVRDLLLGKPLADIDFVVEGDAIALTRRLRDLYGGDIRSHDRFGTGKWFPNEAAWAALAAKLEVPSASVHELPGHIDFVTARTEYYRAPSELPEVEQSSIKHDLHRRDFTINTLAIRLDPANFGHLLDFYGGERDLRENRIRVLHSLSFVDDPTRILRAVRLEQRLGFDIEPRTGELMSHALGLLENLSGDRIRHEIEFVLAEDYPEQSLLRLAQLGILRVIHPDWTVDGKLADQFAAVRDAINKPVWQDLQDVDLELAYFGVLTSALSLRTIEALCKKIKVQRRTVQSLKQLHALKSRLPYLTSALSPGEIDAALTGTDEAALLAAWVIAPPDAKPAISHYARHLRYVEPTITGADLKAYGLKPGPVFKSILKEVRNAWLNGEVSTSDEEKVLVASLVEKSDKELVKEQS